MLSSLQSAIRAERQLNASAPDDDEIQVQMQRAGRDLIARQVLHYDDTHFQTSFRLLRDHKSYFKDLFEALGYEFAVVIDRGYIRLGPGDAGTGARRGKRVNKDETLLLFTLRTLWEESVRSGDAEDYERVETSTSTMADRFTTLGGGPGIPPRTRAMLREWAGYGIIRLGVEDKDEESATLIITPVIADIVTEDMAQAVLEFIATSGASGSDDAFDFLQKRHADTPAPIDPDGDSDETTESLFDA